MSNDEPSVQPELTDPVEPTTIIESDQPEINEAVIQAIYDIRINFTTCGLCGLFLASALLNISERDFENAVANIQDNWITLPWNKSLMDLVDKCFSFVIDIDAYHFEGCCPECSRPYRYVNPDPEKTPTFQIKGII